MLKKMSASFFCAVLYCFSSVMLILSLLVSIRMTALGDEASRLEREIESLQEENTRLMLQYESLVSPDKIEEYAVEVLGMRPLSAEQTEYIEFSD